MRQLGPDARLALSYLRTGAHLAKVLLWIERHEFVPYFFWQLV
jgi:hypothetical protein